MCRDSRRIKQAMNVTRLSEHKYPLASLLYKGSILISVGINKYKSHPRQINHYTEKVGASIHAELNCILGASSDELKGAALYIARRLCDGSSGLARPCASCMKVIEAAKIKRIIFTVYDGFISEDIE